MKIPITENILVKMFLPASGHLPPSIPKVQALDPQTKDAMHAAKDPDKGDLGRVRPGRRDTGNQIFGQWGIEMCQVSMLRHALNAAGYHLNDIHYFEKDHRGRTQYVVCMTYHHRESNSESVKLEREQSQALDMLAQLIWGQVHVWDNSETQSNNFTVNCTALIGDRQADSKLTVRGGKFVEIPAGEEDAVKAA